jgi:2,3-bisphosphoglycerate-dependent phosphoglycerate mutase
VIRWILLACALSAAWSLPEPDLTASQATRGTIFVVRHAERADAGVGAVTMKADPGLSEAGRARAATLVAMLKDARIQQIFVTEYKRTQETAAPLAKASNLVPIVVQASDTAGLAARLRQGGGNALVIGHSNTVPQVLKALGIDEPVTIGDGDYDNLFVVTAGEPPSLIRLHF